jgi:imidazole glycerol phosphate synthase subunit HisF
MRACVYLAAALAAGSVLMGTKLSIWQDENGTYHGFDYDLLREVANRLHIPKIEGATGCRDPAAPGAVAEALRRSTIRTCRIGSANC